MKVGQSETVNTDSAEWLPPTEALTRFQATKAIAGNTLSGVNQETVFGFRVGGLGFLVPPGTYCEVIEQLQVNPLPNVKPWLSGLLNLRGNLVPVIDLRWVFGEEAPDRKKQRLFAIGQGDQAVALWIDTLPETQEITAEPLAQLPPLPDILARWTTSGYLQDGQIWLNVHFEELFKSLGHQYTA